MCQVVSNFLTNSLLAHILLAAIRYRGYLAFKEVATMKWFSVLLLAVAVSFDSLAIGVTYGAAQIKISLLPRFLLSVVSGLFFLVAISIGNILIDLFSSIIIDYLGGGILVLIGIYSIWRTSQYQTNQPQQLTNKKPSQGGQQTVFNLKIPFLGLIINIIKEPLAADYDFSNVISNKEAILLGCALSLDAFGAGLSAAILKIPHVATVIAVMLANFLFISAGLKGGHFIQKHLRKNSLQWIPGIIIILLGIIKLLT